MGGDGIENLGSALAIAALVAVILPSVIANLRGPKALGFVTLLMGLSGGALMFFTAPMGMSGMTVAGAAIWLGGMGCGLAVWRNHQDRLRNRELMFRLLNDERRDLGRHEDYGLKPPRSPRSTGNPMEDEFRT